VKKKKITQAELAQKVLPELKTSTGVHYLTRWGQGYELTKLLPIHVHRLCKVLMIDANFLYGIKPMII